MEDLAFAYFCVAVLVRAAFLVRKIKRIQADPPPRPGYPPHGGDQYLP